PDSYVLVAGFPKGEARRHAVGCPAHARSRTGETRGFPKDECWAYHQRNSRAPPSWFLSWNGPPRLQGERGLTPGREIGTIAGYWIILVWPCQAGKSRKCRKR